MRDGQLKILVTQIPLDLTKLEAYNKETLELANKLKEELGDSASILDTDELTRVLESPEKYKGRTLIEPGLLSHKRMSSTKLNAIFSFLTSTRRKLGIRLIILVGDFDWLDKRIRDQWDIIER